MDELVWEQIVDKHQSYTYRAKVFGGWLVKILDNVCTLGNYGYSTISFEQGHEWRTSMTFVPDINHEWQVKTR